MKKSVKAALWSGLLFPGTGHFVLKRLSRGMVLFVPALAAFTFMMIGVMTQVGFIWDKVESGAVSLDMSTITVLLDSAPGTQMTDIAFWIFVVCWAFGVIDAYLLGNEMDKTQGKTDQAR